MKNVLIPTSYSEDTAHAIEKAILLSGGKPFEIVLLRVTPMPDSIMDFLMSNKKRVQSETLRRRLEEFREYYPIAIRDHHQYGASLTLLEQILTRFEIEVIIVPQSFLVSQESIEQEALETLQRTGLRVIVMPEMTGRDQITIHPGLMPDVAIANH